ncbi:MAG TPA: hypothetical protein ENG52_03270 [Nitrososphaeria archaeon]|nr:hypothetical protein [Nitrososphaeria archaeon]
MEIREISRERQPNNELEEAAVGELESYPDLDEWTALIKNIIGIKSVADEIIDKSPTGMPRVL